MADTDGDGWSDYQEYQGGTGGNADLHPNELHPHLKGSDGLVTDAPSTDVEDLLGSDPGDFADVNDPDGDGLTTDQELRGGSDPSIADSDGDSYSDGAEVTADTDPLDPDSHPAPLPYPTNPGAEASRH